MPESRRVPWWLVPNVLALDAPLVAAAWQRFLAARFAGALPVAATVTLAAAVWCVYLADRRLDARRGALDAERHRAAGRHPRAFAAAATCAAALALAAAARLPAAYWWHGLAVGLGVAGYLAAAHAAGGSALAGGAKELLVGVGFAAGVAVPLSVEGGPAAAWLPSVAAFAGLCWLNCRLIDRWESPGDRPPWADGTLGVGLLLAAAALPDAVGLAVAASVVGLLAVHVTCRRRPRVARVLADAVLLTPLLGWAAP